MNKKISFSIPLLACAMAAQAGISVEKIDPPHWWTGMKETTLQLQVHGHDIRNAEFSVAYPGIVVDSVARLDGSPDWQFAYLTVTPEAKPGVMTLKWKEGKKSIERKFELKRRVPNGGAKGFTSADVLYMIMPDRFADGNPANNLIKEMNNPVGAERSNLNRRHGGDLEGIARHIDYIDSLGVTAVWLNPVLENDMPGGSYHGYATTDYYAVDRRFGTNEQYRELIDTLHSRDIKMVMDMIFNHCGSGHPWLAAPPASDWFNFQGDVKITNHKLSTVTDPYASDYDLNLCTSGWFVEDMPDLNQKNPHLMKYLVQNSIFWIEEAGIDAIRMDTYPYADKKEMGEWVKAVTAEYPDFTIVGECWFAQPSMDAAWQTRSPLAAKVGDSDLEVVMDFPLMMLSRDLAPYREQTNSWGGLSKIYDHLAGDFIYGDINKVLRFLDNHDTERMMLEPPTDLGAWKQAMTILLTIPGIPQLYYGTELLMTGDRKPGDGNVRRDMPGGFPGDETSAFVPEGRTDLQNEAYDFLSRILNWRKGNKAVAEGSMKHFIPADGIYLYRRLADDGSEVIVALNGTDSEVDADMSRFLEVLLPGKSYHDVVSDTEIVPIADSAAPFFTFKPRQIMILESNGTR